MELRQRTDGLNTILQAMLSSLRAGVVVVDNKDKILVWNLKAEDLWGVCADEANGQSLFQLGVILLMEEME